MKKILLIDGNSLLFRAYYATAYGGQGSAGTLLRSKDGTPTNAIFALANIMTKLLNDTPPDYVLVAFDSPEPTFRHKVFEDYKAGRKETPPELIAQFPLAIAMLEKMGMHTCKQAGVEADDIIGTIAKKAAIAGMQVEIFSGDKDFLQLIDEHIIVKLTKKGLSELQVMDKKALADEYELAPRQIIDLKGLMGDPSDNIPGIRGVGEKTALKLLKQYHTIEAVLEADIAGKLGERIKESKEIALLSKQLATIHCDVILDFSPEDLAYKGPNQQELLSFYQRYDMHSLLKKIPNKNEKIAIDYQLVTTVDKTYLRGNCTIIVELEGDNYHTSPIVGLALSFEKGQFFIQTQDLVKDSDLIAYLGNPAYEKYGYDIKSVIVSLHRLEIEISELNFDLILAAYLLQPSLKEEPAIVFDYFGFGIDYKNNVYSKKGYDLEQVANYACMKTHYLWQAKTIALEKLQQEDVLHLYQEVEVPLAKVLAKMEITGVKLDLAFLEEKSKEVQIKLDQLTIDIYALTEAEFNINSPAQMAKVLFDQLQLPLHNRRSTSAETLEYLKPFHPAIEKILDYRRYAKLQSTYLQGLPQYALADQKIHTIFNQALTLTGRLSSKEPNIQNITIRDEESSEVRKAFVASEKGWYILSFDYSQIELRILAHMANATSMIKAFNNNEDIHTTTASAIFNVAEEDVVPSMRRQAKTINFGIIYGMSDWGLKDELGTSVKEAKEFIERYFASYPEIKQYFDRTIEECRQNGYVKTYFNRIRYVKEINDSNYNVREFGKRVAMNSPIQGTAADIIKKAMLGIDAMLRGQKLKTRMILQVHDELVFEVPFEELMSTIPLIQQIMENIVDFKVKLSANYGYGYNWYDTK